MADLKIGTVILPRSETPQIVSRLTEFEWFHKIDSASETVTPEVDDILLKENNLQNKIYFKKLLNAVIKSYAG